GEKRQREGALDLSHAPIERQFTGDEKILVLIVLNEIRPAKHADRHRQIKGGPFLLHIRWREVDEQSMTWKRIPAVDHGAADALDGFFNRRLREPDNDGLGEAALRDIHFHFAQKRI